MGYQVSIPKDPKEELGYFLVLKSCDAWLQTVGCALQISLSVSILLQHIIITIDLHSLKKCLLIILYLVLICMYYIIKYYKHDPFVFFYIKVGGQTLPQTCIGTSISTGSRSFKHFVYPELWFL